MHTYNKRTCRAAARLMAVMAAVVTTLISCYRIVLIEQDHTVACGSRFHGKLVVKASGSNDNGNVSQVYGLFGVRVPEGWTACADIVMTQVPKATTDLGDPAYNATVTRHLTVSDKYTDLLNRDYPRRGYKWVGFVTDTDFKSMFNNKDCSKDVDSIYVSYSFNTPAGVTGVYYLEYVAGHVNRDKLPELGTADRDWSTRTATFAGANITHVSGQDTRVVVTNADGTYDQSNDEYAQPAEWQLEAMPRRAPLGNARAYKDLKYDAIFTRTRGWNGGDGVLTVALPGGNVLWTFNDSFYGVVDGATRARGSSSFPRNSLMLQRGRDGKPGEEPSDFVWLANYVNWTDPNAGRYFHARTHLRHPLGEKTDEEIAAGDIDQNYVYWSGDGTVVDGKLQMIWSGVEAAKLRNIGTALATYDLSGTVPEGRYLPDIPDYLPRRGDYLFRRSVTHGVNDHAVAYGSTLWEDADGHTYLYAANGNDMVVARTATHSLYSQWQYYVRTAGGTWQWQDQYPDDETMKRSNVIGEGGGGVMLPWVFKEGDWYYMTTQAPIFSPDVYIYRSRNPWGPFDDRRLLFRLPETLDKLGPTKYHWLYMVNLHPALSRQGELVFSTNSDPDDFWDNFNAVGSADYYRPFFYRVFDWQSVYPDTQASPVGGVTAGGRPADGGVYYSLQGIPVRHPSAGVYVHGGRKVVVRAH